MFEREGGLRGLSSRAVRTTVVVVAALGVVSFAVVQVRFRDRFERIAAAAEANAAAPAVATARVEARCDALGALAASSGADWVVFVHDRTAAYACGAQWYDDGLRTVFPEYDRRTWDLVGAATVPATAIVVADENSCPRLSVVPEVRSCTYSPGLDATVVATDPVPPLVVLRGGGITVRPFADPASTLPPITVAPPAP